MAVMPYHGAWLRLKVPSFFPFAGDAVLQYNCVRVIRPVTPEAERVSGSVVIPKDLVLSQLPPSQTPMPTSLTLDVISIGVRGEA
jgi:hypothetical protein